MKELWLVRHAKSSWADGSIADHDRPLNKRGRNDAPFMSNMLMEKGHIPQLIITSSANRAKTTAEIFERNFNSPDLESSIDPDLYHAPGNRILKVIRGISQDVDRAMIFGHNPGMTNAVNRLTNSAIDNVPTCGISYLISDAEHWSDIDFGSMTLKSFDYPKKFKH